MASVTSDPTRRLRMVVAYDGSDFHGFALQPGVTTVAGAICAALERALRHTVELTCAGRTDAGVHAWGQVINFEARYDAEPVALQRALNKALRPAIVIRESCVAEDGFDARRSATGRRYHYTIRNDPVADPFTARTAWHVTERLDLPAMRLACDPLIGEHDFSAFCRRPPGEGSLIRKVRDARWVDLSDSMLRFEIEASSFCHQMVRSIVGMMVEIGIGKKRAGDVAQILRSRSRQGAGQLAPPHGLCLWEVTY
ncbi:MAG TPA: tRNA pseudouridine(38-40) synthase TruA [Acidimicrobiales bacterium]|nr:tRNA pseudouridine(38-40) synthase TruA [Acidimicrobiales bacterium]